MFWKIYFWFFILLLILGYSTGGIGGIWGIIDSVISLGALGGLYLYAYRKTLFSSMAWKTYLFMFVIWDLTYNIIIQPRASGTAFDPINLIGLLFVVPVYIALYLYGFRFLKEKESRQ